MAGDHTETLESLRERLQREHRERQHRLNTPVRPHPEWKLIRDRMVDAIPEKDRRVASEDEVEALLPEALQEAVDKLLETGGQDIEGYADVLELLHTIAERRGYSPEEIEAARLKKHEEQGGFQDGVIWRFLDRTKLSFQRILSVYWSKRGRKFIVNSPSKADGALIWFGLDSKRCSPRMGQFLNVCWDPSLLDELRQRGYDLKTLRFSIRRTEEASGVPEAGGSEVT